MMKVSTKALPVFAVSVAATLAFTACGGGSGSQVAGGKGEARIVRIKALDAFRFDPSNVDVKRGERVRFVVTNSGRVEHEFIVGNEEVQKAHERMMRNEGMSMSMGTGAKASLSLNPGGIKEATVTFNESGRVLFGCHVAGHYKAGMVGTVNVA